MNLFQTVHPRQLSFNLVGLQVAGSSQMGYYFWFNPNTVRVEVWYSIEKENNVLEEVEVESYVQ